MNCLTLTNSDKFEMTPNKLQHYLDTIDYSQKTNDIIKLLELYQIKRWLNGKDIGFFKHDVKSMLEQQKGDLPLLNSTINQSISQKSSETWLNNFLSLWKTEEELSLPHIQEVFNSFFVKYTLWEQLPDASFKNYLDQKSVDLESILSHKKIVTQFSDILCDYMKSNEKNILSIIQLLLKRKETTLNFPNHFLKNYFNTVINNFINFLNKQKNIISYEIFITDLLRIKNENEIKWDPKIKASLKELRERIDEGHTNSYLDYSIRISISNSQKEPVLFSQDRTTTSISQEFIDQSSDYGLLKFIISFFFDESQSLKIISKSKTVSVFDAINQMKSEKNGGYFQSDQNYFYDQYLTALIAAISSHLSTQNRSFEDIFENYFNNFIENNYSISKFKFDNIPSQILPHKIKLLATEIESVLRQFKLFIQYGEVNLKYLEYSDRLQSYRNIPTLNDSPLFSKDEADYFHYYLNDKDFSNNLGIRNSYIHASHHSYSDDEHYTNYISLVKLFIIVIGKLDQQFKQVSLK